MHTYQTGVIDDKKRKKEHRMARQKIVIVVCVCVRAPRAPQQPGHMAVFLRFNQNRDKEEKEENYTFEFLSRSTTDNYIKKERKK